MKEHEYNFKHMCIIAVTVLIWSAVLSTILLPVVVVAMVTPLGNSRKLDNFLSYPMVRMGKWIAQDEFKTEAKSRKGRSI
jgi:hypothetical protein